MRRMIDNLRIADCAMRYSQFVPRLYNYCRSLGFERDRMMPSRAFCSDESQGRAAESFGDRVEVDEFGQMEQPLKSAERAVR